MRNCFKTLTAGILLIAVLFMMSSCTKAQAETSAGGEYVVLYDTEVSEDYVDRTTFEAEVESSEVMANGQTIAVISGAVEPDRIRKQKGVLSVEERVWYEPAKESVQDGE